MLQRDEPQEELQLQRLLGEAVSSSSQGVCVIDLTQHAAAAPSGEGGGGGGATGVSGLLGSLAFCNPALCELTGYSQQELMQGGLALLLGGPADGVQHHQQQLALQVQVQAALASAERCTLELPCQHRAGGRVWCSVMLSQLPPPVGASLALPHRPGAAAADAAFAAGAPAAAGARPRRLVMAQFTDVTSYKTQQAAFLLRDKVLDVVQEGITIADTRRPNAPITYTNEAFLSMTGYGREEVRQTAPLPAFLCLGVCVRG